MTTVETTQKPIEAKPVYRTFIIYAIILLVIGVAVGYVAKYFAGASAEALNAKIVINSGDTAWVLTSAALVMLMTPAVGFFYGGMVASKNVVSVIKQSLLILALISIQWVLVPLVVNPPPVVVNYEYDEQTDPDSNPNEIGHGPRSCHDQPTMRRPARQAHSGV